MRTIERTSAFKKDYKRVRLNPRHRNIDGLPEDILGTLLLDHPLAEKYSDHALIGE